MAMVELCWHIGIMHIIKDSILIGSIASDQKANLVKMKNMEKIK